MGLRRTDEPRPWRDYPDEITTDPLAAVERPFSEPHLIVGCRNVLNEARYQARLDGVWWRRDGDPSVPEYWPVLEVRRDGVSLRPLASTDSRSDVVTGVPLVVDGMAMSRSFLVRHCSDVAHSYELHPKGLIGPSSQAWNDLSDAWQELEDAGADQETTFERMEEIATRHGAEPSENLLHSACAVTETGELAFFAVTGALASIARELAARWDVRHAVVLDNGGSVGWQYGSVGNEEFTLLVGGANRRRRGTVFLVLHPREFLRPLAHPGLARFERRRDA